MSLRKLKNYVLPFALLLVGGIEVAFNSPQDKIVTVHGRGLFDFRTYSNMTIQVTITENGKFYKKLTSDDRGNFTANIGLNKIYMFNLSMDYHGTSRVQIDTRVPEVVAQDMKGAEFEFECEMYELYQGMNMGLLNRPLLKMKYNAKKDRFEFDKEYAEAMRFDVESFLNRMADMKAQKRKVLKGEPKKQEANEDKKDLAREDKKEERKVIAFEVEKKKVAENKRGSKNIMEFLEEPKKVEVKPVEEDSTEAVALNTEDEDEDDEVLALNIVPKRFLIDEGEKELNESEQERELEMQKMRRREAQEVRRLAEEAKIREQVRSLNRQKYEMREKRMINKKIQTNRLEGLIKTVALAELFERMQNFDETQSKSNLLPPSIVEKSYEGFWVDEEKVMVRYPGEKAIFSKKTYLFGFTYYFRDDEEISEDLYCQTLGEYSQNIYACVN